MDNTKFSQNIVQQILDYPLTCLQVQEKNDIFCSLITNFLRKQLHSQSLIRHLCKSNYRSNDQLLKEFTNIEIHPTLSLVMWQELSIENRIKIFTDSVNYFLSLEFSILEKCSKSENTVPIKDLAGIVQLCQNYIGLSPLIMNIYDVVVEQDLFNSLDQSRLLFNVSEENSYGYVGSFQDKTPSGIEFTIRFYVFAFGSPNKMVLLRHKTCVLDFYPDISCMYDSSARLDDKIHWRVYENVRLTKDEKVFTLNYDS